MRDTAPLSAPATTINRLALIARDASFGRRYELLNRIGVGAFAEVYRATERSTGREVAVKVLMLDEVLDGSPVELQVARFRREVEVCSRLSHPNIVRLLEAGEVSREVLYAVFAHASGSNLADLLALRGPLRPDSAIRVMTQVLTALASAHESGVVHRDVKPDNIVVDASGGEPRAMVLDFGLGVLSGTTGRWSSRLTMRGEFLGTPAYAAPEQLRGEEVTPAADLYAWSLTAIEALTGERVMAGATLQETIFRQLGPDPVALPAGLRGTAIGDLLRDACDKDPARRPTDALALERLAGVGLPTVLRGLAAEARQRPGEDDRPTAGRAATASEASVAVLPLLRNPRFRGREQLLADVERELHASNLLAVCALKGLGGVGKTQIALEYAYRHAGEYRLVAWLRAEDPGVLDADFAQLATALRLPEAEAPEDYLRIQATRRWLETHDRWLLIFDNVSAPRAIRSYLPRTQSGHVLITSRNQSWQSLARSVAVDVMTAEESVELLLDRSGSEQREAAAELADLLGHLPLALEEAAAYVETTGRTLADYVRLFREHQTDLLRQSLPPADYPATLRTTWDLALERLSREEPGSAELLAVLAHLGPDDLPRSALVPRRRDATPDAARLELELAVDRQIASLLRYSLVRIEDDALSVHRLLQAVIRDRLDGAARAAAAERALRLVERAFPRSGTAGRARPECTRLLPHAIAALGHSRHLESCRIHVARLLERTGVYLAACGWSDDAVKHLNRSVAIFDAMGPEHAGELARASDGLGMVLYQIGQLDGAAEASQRAVSTFAHGADADPGSAARSLINLAWIRWSEGRMSAAEEAARRSVALLGSGAAGADPTVASASAVLARALLDSGRIDEAKRTADEVAAILGRPAPPLHPLLCGALLHLSQVACSLGRTEAALHWARAGVGVGERAYGRHHPFVSGTRCVLGQALLDAGAAELARGHLEEALSSAEAAPSRIDQHVAIAGAFLVEALLSLGDVDGAAAAAARAAALAVKVCGARGQLDARLEMARARLALGAGRPDEAQRRCENGYAQLATALGRRHPGLAAALALLGELRLGCGDVTGAIAAFESGLDLAAAAGLETHPACGPLHHHLAAALDRAGDAERAAAHRERAARIAASARAAAAGAPGAAARAGDR